MGGSEDLCRRKDPPMDVSVYFEQLDTGIKEVRSKSPDVSDSVFEAGCINSRD